MGRREDVGTHPHAGPGAQAGPPGGTGGHAHGEGEGGEGAHVGEVE